MSEPIRRPVVDGLFYARTREALIREIERCYLDKHGAGALPTVNEMGPRQLIGLVSPHAGYKYSGACAAKGMSVLAADGRPEVVVIIGPNHRRGRPVNAIQTHGAWSTPLGESPICEGVARAIATRCSGLQDGPEWFVEEHSLEVQLPFVQHLYGLDMPIVPIMMLDQDAESAQAIGSAVAEAVRDTSAVIIASSDMTHYESAELARRQDRILIERMEALDPQGLVRECDLRGISMCGPGPVAAMLFAALELGATKAKTIDYTNSGVAEPGPRVVAYLSLGVWRR